MDPTRGDSRYNLNYSMGGIGLVLPDQTDLYGNATSAAALGGRPPSGGLLQAMGGGSLGLSTRSTGGLMSSSPQCQSLGQQNPTNNASGTSSQQQQARGIKRTNSDCYEDHRSSAVNSGMSNQMQGLDGCGSGANNQQQGGGMIPDVVDDSYNSIQSKKSPPANGKKTKGRVKIKMEYIDNKLRRYTTFSKRKTGIMKKAYELSTLTGTQVMLLVASETGHVYTFATRKLQPMITSEAGKQLIQTCLNSPDPPSVGSGDQRMSATGFEETELSYNIADEDSKDARSPISSVNDTDDSSDVDSPGPGPSVNRLQSNQELIDGIHNIRTSTTISSLTDTSKPTTSIKDHHVGNILEQQSLPFENNVKPSTSSRCKTNKLAMAPMVSPNKVSKNVKPNLAETGQQENYKKILFPQSTLSNIPNDILLQLIQSGHLQLHTENDGSGHQYITIPLTLPLPSQTKAKDNIGNSQQLETSISSSIKNDDSIINSNSTAFESDLQSPQQFAENKVSKIKQELLD